MVGIFFEEFHMNTKLLMDLISYFLTLVPKVDCYFSLGDFKHISMLGCLYKLVTMVLTSRLGEIMHWIVAKN